MRRLVLLAALAAPLCAAPEVHAAGDPGVRELLEELVPREGVGTRSIHVVPLVSVTADVREGWRVTAPSASWEPAVKGDDLVDLGAAEGGELSVIPAGTVLTGGARERLLAWTEPLVDAQPRGIPAPVCDVRKTPAPAGMGRLGPLAPLGQRKLLLLGERNETLGLLLRIQQVVANAPAEAETLSEILAVPWLRERADETCGVLERIPRAYAGRTRGHVVFFGFRVVEIVVARSPADYRAVATRYLRSCAVTHALWERALGLEERPMPPASAGDYLPPAQRAVAQIARVRTKRWPRLSGRRGAWSNTRGQVVGAHTTDNFVVRVVEAGGETPLLIEAIENGDRTVHPLPLRAPGGRPLDEGPDVTGGGLTDEYLERLMKRRAEREARSGE